ncbi:hypothetical protein J2Y74_002006 [Pseudomonas migulae]|nr:hypothetical protein [Pseudomonas migulae]
MPAMAVLRALSPASRLLRIGGGFGIGGSRQTCRSRLAGDGDFTDAFAGKPGSYNIAGGFGIGGSRQTCRSRLAGDGGLTDAIAGKPGSYNIAGGFGIGGSRQTCRSRLAGDGDFTDAIAGKPGSYGSRGCSGLGLRRVETGMKKPNLKRLGRGIEQARVSVHWRVSIILSASALALSINRFCLSS